MNLEWKPVAPGAWTAVTEPDSANVTLVAGKREGLLIDCGGTTEVGAQVLASARELAGVPVNTVVITHHHYDHWDGLAGMRGVSSIGHENLLEEEHAPELTPTVTFSLAHALDLGECLVELIHFGPAHTRSDLIVNIPSKSLTIVGDLLEEEPQFDATSCISKWPSVLDSALGSARADTVFIPGHGDPSDREAVMLCGGKLSFLYSTAKDLLEQGKQPAEIFEAVDEWPFSEETVRSALPFVIAELEAEGVRPRTLLPLL